MIKDNFLQFSIKTYVLCTCIHSLFSNSNEYPQHTLWRNMENSGEVCKIIPKYHKIPTLSVSLWSHFSMVST